MGDDGQSDPTPAPPILLNNPYNVFDDLVGMGYDLVNCYRSHGAPMPCTHTYDQTDQVACGTAGGVNWSNAHSQQLIRTLRSTSVSNKRYYAEVTIAY
jgi:hypothetical protein